MKKSGNVVTENLHTSWDYLSSKPLNNTEYPTASNFPGMGDIGKTVRAESDSNLNDDHISK